MPEPKNSPGLKAERVLKRVTDRRFTFEGDPADLDLLRSVCDGSCLGTKPGDPSFHAYVTALNLANDFANQALDILELIPFNNQLADIQEEYMPSYPPMSPVTNAYFGGWMVCDARDPFTRLTLGELFLHHLQHKGKLENLWQAMRTLNDSYCSFYEVTDVNAQGLRLWDIASKQEIDCCWNSSGYSGQVGEIWYVRLLPPFSSDFTRFVTVSTPYVYRGSDRHTWESFFQRCATSEFGAGHSLRDYLKYGKSLGYWLEFLFQAYEGCTGNMVMVTGIPDDPASLPHSDPRHKL